MSFRALSLCVCAVSVLSITAASAPTASALQFHASEYPATLSGVQTNENVFSNGIRSITCSEATLTGSLSGASGSFTYAPTYSGCTGNGSTTATVNTNGCTYTISSPTETAPGEGEAQTTLNCPAGKSITVDIWATGKSHGEAQLCSLALPAQGPFGFIWKKIKKFAKDAWKFIKHFANTQIKRLVGTSVNCGIENKTNGTFTGEQEFSGENKFGQVIDISIK